MRGNFILGLMLIAAFFLSLVAGKVWISPFDWWSGGTGGWIMAELRLPRAILGLSIGAVLGLSGAVLQGYLRNPLADPTIIGVSSSAALGGVASLFFGATIYPLSIFVSAMTAAMLSIILLSAMAGGGRGSLGFILGGIALSTLSGSLTAFLISIAPNPYATSEIINWLMGALTDRSTGDVIHALPFMLAGGAILLTTGSRLDALTLGEAGARSLGVNLHILQWAIILGVGLSVGASVAVSGVVGFVGLIVPHIMRYYFGEKPSGLLLPSMLGGAILLLVGDSLVRLLPGIGEIRLGIVMSVLGAPFFLMLLIKKRGVI